MSDWYWRVIALKAAFVLTCLASSMNSQEVRELPFCNPHTTEEADKNDLIIVSTLDGRLSAFSASSGIKAWDVETQPLLSSNVHHVELSSGGKWVRLVPSLRGSLYSMTGDTVEPLPFDAEQLLSSSFKYSDDLVIAGAREAHWLGIDAESGSVQYSCGGAGCSAGRGAQRPLVVLRRLASTVRAVDPRSGQEKWNFSVATHELAVSGAPPRCGPGGGVEGELAVRLALPEGLIGVSSGDHALMLWQKKLSAPVAGLWRLRGGWLQRVDVMEAATPPALGAPSLYVGVYDQQLYIQEGQLYVQKLQTAVSSKPVPWKLKAAQPLLTGPENTALLPVEANTLSLITLYGSTGKKGDHGFFLYQDETCDRSVQVTEADIEPATRRPPVYIVHESDSDHHHVHVYVYSLWFWWKEVLLIAISSALLMNLMIWPRFFARNVPQAKELARKDQGSLSIPPPGYTVYPNGYPTVYPNGYPNVYPSGYEPASYSGRYDKDFTPLRCLGRGGFGVVFEARNNIDHCSYAVKRITLPKRESKRERVLREVRALAKLEHEHIVRYFNAWLEQPPTDWQRHRDSQWLRELDGVSVSMSSEESTPLPPRDSVRLDLRGVADGLDHKRTRSLSFNDSLSIVFDENAPSRGKDLVTSDLSITPNILSKNLGSGDNDDSFIVFADSQDVNHNSNMSEATNKQLDLVKAEEGKGRKKGHTRHWSLDMSRDCEAVSREAPGPLYLYIQMQLCRPDSLHDWLRNNNTHQARAEQVPSLFSQIVSAVEYVHLAGLIHRDLKPSNIFFAPDGKVKVGDFGLVTALGDNSSDEGGTDPLGVSSRHTYRVGTHLYMSPEQLSGRPYSLKVDVYSLGLVLGELLCPFHTEAERVAALLGLREGRYPHGLADRYPDKIIVIKQMLNKDPDKRPTATEVKETLQTHTQTLTTTMNGQHHLASVEGTKM